MNQKAFTILPYHEEQKLSMQELNDYYDVLRSYAKKRKLTNTTRMAESIAPKLKGITNKIAETLIPILAGGKCERITEGRDNIPDGAVIFAATHQGILDNFAWIPSTPKHSIILHGAGVRKLLIAAQVNTGLVMVNKNPGHEENRKNAKLDMIRLLLDGNCITYFPEGTWNLSPNKLHLPMSFGFLDVARKANVPVVPVVFEYSYDSSREKERITLIHIRFGTPIYVKTGDDLNDKLCEYSEQIATMRYEMIEKKGLFSRDNISETDYINYLKGNFKSLKFGHLNWEEERRNMFHSSDEKYLFQHLNDIPFDSHGHLLPPPYSLRY